MTFEAALDVPAIVVELLAASGLPVAGERPEQPTLPLVTVDDAGGGSSKSGQPVWVQRGDVNIDVWSHDRADGRDVADHVRFCILQAPRNHATTSSGVVIATRCQPPYLLRDNDLLGPDGQAAYRHMLFASVTCRPLKAGEADT